MYNFELFSAQLDSIVSTAAAFEGLPAVGTAVNGVPSSTLRKRWQSVKNDMHPHLTGTIPALIDEALEMETARQKNYRKKIYRSETVALLEQAMVNVYKIAQSNDFIVEYSTEGAGSVEAVLSRSFFDSTPLGGGNLKKEVFNALYKFRVGDPNGYIGIFPKSDPVNGNARIMEVVLYPSENILYRSLDICIFSVPNPNSNSIGCNTLHVYTRNSSFVFDTAANTVATSAHLKYGGWVHKTGILGCFVAGGRAQIAEEINGEANKPNNYSGSALSNTNLVYFFASDFSYAVPILDKVEALNSQLTTTIFKHIFPKMIGRQMACDECEGKGNIQVIDQNGDPILEPDMRSGHILPKTATCNSCKGTGITSVGVQDVIQVPMSFGGIVTADTKIDLPSLKDGVFAYVTPDIETPEFLDKSVDKAKGELKEALNLRSIKDFAESGAAKQLDEDVAQPRLRAIAEGVGSMFQNILLAAIALDHNQGYPLDPAIMMSRVESVKVSVPAFFDMLTSAETQTELFNNLEQKPLFERYNERLKLMKKQGASAEDIASFGIAYEYTNGLNLQTLSELSNLRAMEIITADELWIAVHIDGVIKNILRKKRIQGKGMLLSSAVDFAEIFSLIEEQQKIKAEAIKVARQPIMPQLSNALDDEEGDDEDE